MDWTKLLSVTRSAQFLRGRVGTSQPRDDPRSQFERDYGRAVFSTAVRRLQDKAQVFPLEPNDAVRTRLTHSLEVSTIAKSISDRATARLVDSNVIDEEQAKSIGVIAMTCGLLHDIGNPPFGHSGEESIQEWFARQFGGELARVKEVLDGQSAQLSADFINFDGNAQTLRLVSQLQMLADRNGLNLTAGTLSALCKYLPPAHKVISSSHAYSKPGWFASEARLDEAVRGETGTGEARNPITYLVEAADDIVYSTVDLEDGVKKGVLTWESLCARLREESGDDALVDTVIKKVNGYKWDATLAPGDEAKAQLFRTFAMYEHVSAICEVFDKRYSDIMDGRYMGELCQDQQCWSGTLMAVSKRIARKYVYPMPEILRLELMGRRVVHDLLTFFWKGAASAPGTDPKWERSVAGKVYKLMSHNYRTVFSLSIDDDKRDQHGLPVEYRRLQLIVDYIAGMTDSFATDLHRELLGAS
jgi:dGTPase